MLVSRFNQPTTQERRIALKSIKKKKIDVVNGKTLIVTVDIGKNIHYGYCVAPGKGELKIFKFSHNQAGFQKLWQKMLLAKRRFDSNKVIVGFESTAAYAEPLVHFLMKKPVKLVQVNPMHTKRVKEITDNSPHKTDKKDPQVIADLIRLGRFLSVVVPDGFAACLRRYTQTRERQVALRTVYINQLQHLLSMVFPEFIKIMKGTKSITARYLIRNYPLPVNLACLDPKQLAGDIKKISRGRLGQKRAEELLQAASHSIGINKGLSAIVLEINHLLNQMETADKFISNIEQKMETELKRVPLARRFLSIKGLGVVTVAGVMGEVADFEKFTCQAEVIKFAGLNLYEISSGRFKGQRHISKRGRALLRKLLYFASLGMVKKNGIMHDYYQKLTKRGMAKPKALIAVSRKLLRIMFAMVRDNTCYRADYQELSQAVFKKAA